MAADFIELETEWIGLEYRDVDDNPQKIFNDLSFDEALNHKDQIGLTIYVKKRDKKKYISNDDEYVRVAHQRNKNSVSLGTYRLIIFLIVVVLLLQVPEFIHNSRKVEEHEGKREELTHVKSD